MRSIIRCPQCFTYVYSDAKLCHGCGHRIGKRRWLTRGSWVFITLAVAGYGIARGIDLHQEKRDQDLREAAQAREMQGVRAFLETWLTAQPHQLASKYDDRKSFGQNLVALRDRFPDVFPATVVDLIRIEPEGWEHHKQSGSTITHPGHQRTKLRVSRSVRATEYFSARSWWTNAYGFEAELHRDDQWFSVKGQVCIDEERVYCLAIERIESIEGEIKPTE